MPATKRLSNVEELKCPNTPKNSDDSGYMEAILLEEQKAVEIDSEKKLPNFESYDLAIEEDQVSMLKNINDYNNYTKNPLLNLEPLKTGEMFAIKQSESHVMQAKAEETLYENVTEPATSVQMSSFQKSSFNLPPPTKGILEKSDDLSKGCKKDEKVGKNVSYDDVISDTDDMKKSDKTTEQPESYPIVGYSPSDDKHFVVTEQQTSVDKVKKNRTETRRIKDENSPTNRSLEIKDERDGYYKVCQKNKAFKDKGVFNKENKDKGKKNISIDVPDSDVHLCSKETNINTSNSNPSTESSKEIVPSGETSPKCQYLSHPTDKDGIKVIKDVRSNSDMNVPNPENTKYPNEEIPTGNEKMKKSKTKRNRTSIEHQIEKFRNKNIKQLGQFKNAYSSSSSSSSAHYTSSLRSSEPALNICEKHAVICTCPRAARRDVRVFRTCSGTGRFATVTHTPPDTGMRHCACASTTGTQTQKFRDSGDGGTYIVHAETAVRMCARAEPAAPVDTDGEISGLTDLPDEISGRSAVSAGEARAYTTCTDTATDCITLSEGELPLHAHCAGQYSVFKTPPFSTSQRVEDALQAIGEELARCRALLQRQRPQQGKSSKDMSCNTEGASDALALRRAEGQARIVAAHSHICHFTLHIGTLVLSDQVSTYYCGGRRARRASWPRTPTSATSRCTSARSCSPTRYLPTTAAGGGPGAHRGRALPHLPLHAAHRHARALRPGIYLLLRRAEGQARIVAAHSHICHFTLHIGTLVLSDQEEMKLKICEANKMDEVFASCALPLHDSLLHANRRADMSLPLVAGEEILSSRVVTDALDSGEEAGVLDVWCQLRLDPALLSALRKGSSKVQAATMSVAASEDQASVYHLTRELEANMQRNSKNNKQLTVRSSQEVRQAVVHEIRPPSKLRVLVERSSIVTNLGTEEEMHNQTLDITVVWLALSEESEAMTNPDVQRLFVAYSFLGREGAELETPVSLPKPKSCNDKCYFNFNKQFVLNDSELPLLGHMARCRQRDSAPPAHTDCLTFAVVSEPPEDPLGLDTCEDIGYAHLYLGDVLARCAGSDSYTEVLSVHARSGTVCGVLAVRLAGLHVLRRLWSVPTTHYLLPTAYFPRPTALVLEIFCTRFHDHSAYSTGDGRTVASRTTQRDIPPERSVITYRVRTVPLPCGHSLTLC
ncbi:Protein fantom [Papilio machaon]|uniref:Protein fantom n=1 Tax=Papilio machaon TaxID=76193 RepID=A0A0N1PJM6_PAPMA|nr:Protein fantom [Papilio machaon]